MNLEMSSDVLMFLWCVCGLMTISNNGKDWCDFINLIGFEIIKAWC